MIPFDRVRAEAGVQVITRDGRKVLRVVWLPEARKDGCIVALIEDGTLLLTDESGKHCYQDNCYFDLCMAPKKRTVWVNVYENSKGYGSYGSAYPTEVSANTNTVGGRIGNRAWPLEIEE